MRWLKAGGLMTGEGSNPVKFIVWGEPQGKQRVRVANGHGYTPQKTVEYEAEVVRSIRRDCPGFVRWEKGIPLRVRIRAYYAIPKSASRKDEAAMRSGALRPTKKPDADNIEKVICDALNAVLWHDDAQIVDSRCIKAYGEPRVEVEVSPIKY